jgi:hypothetical protein
MTLSPKHIEKLGLEVEARNRLNVLCNKGTKFLYTYFSSIEGKKICNVDGSLNKKTKKQIDNLLNPVISDGSNWYSWYLQPYKYAIDFCISTTYEHDGLTNYVRAHSWVCDIKDGVVVIPISSEFLSDHRKTDYDLTTIIQKKKRIESLQKEIESIKEEIGELYQATIVSKPLG